MNKHLKQINKIIKIEDNDFKKIHSDFRKIKRELNLNKKFKIVGSFEKGLVSKKTKDMDIDIIIPASDSSKKEAESIKVDIMEYFSGVEKFSNGKVSIEVTYNDFIYSFTIIEKNCEIENKFIFNQNSSKINNVISKRDKEELNEKINLIPSKQQRWNVRKFIRIMVYLIEESRHNLPKYQLETILLNELTMVSSTNVNRKFIIFKKFFAKLGNCEYDSMLKNLIEKNKSAYESLVGRASKIAREIDNYDLQQFCTWFEQKQDK